MIRRQVLDGAVARGDDGSEIRWTELVDGRRRNPFRGDRRRADWNRAVKQNDDEATFVLCALVRRHIAWHLARPRGVACLNAIRQVNLGERLDRAWLIVFEDGEGR